MSLRHPCAALLLAFSLVCACATASAADNGTDTAAIPVKDFARHAQLMSPRLSPDGKYLALRYDYADSNTHALLIFEVADMSKPIQTLKMKPQELPANIIWVSPTRLIVEKGKEFGSIGKPQLTGEIIATDIDGKHQDYLYGYHSDYGSRASTRGRDRGFGFYVGKPEPPKDHFYMMARIWGDTHHSWLYNVDAHNNTRHLIGDIGVSDMAFMVGADGKAHFAYGTNDDLDYVVYHRANGRWNQMSSAQVGKMFQPITYTPDHQNVYAYYSADGGPADLIEQGETSANRTVLAADGFGSIGDIQWTPLPHQPFAAVADTGIPEPIYINPDLPSAKLYKALSLKFPGEFVNFINYSEDGATLLFRVSSDRDPGAYYLINTHDYKVQKLFAAASWIDPSKMAERRPFHFKASDGKELEGILTIPRDRTKTNLPMVLFPHGGPHGPSDDWFFDMDAQFLASRGYLVLQVNYRGSGGRGRAFEHAGYLKWGTRIQQDLIDGVKWTIAQKLADPKRICVYGGSFGGYSALMSVIRAPHLFQCAIGYDGVYDLAMMYKKGDVRQSKSGRNYLTEVIGKNNADLDANSPDKLADKIDVPVFLIHGEDDERAPFAQAKAMRAALDAANKTYEWMTRPGEGHGFYKVQNNIDRLNKMQAFLEKYIGKGAPQIH